MLAIVKELDTETRDKLVNRYFWGESAIFAKMLHDVFSWPLVGIVVGKLVRHAGVRHPAGTILDSRGFHETDEDFAAAFVDEQPDYVVRDIEPDDIREHHNVTRLAKDRARIAAEHILPGLPWPERSAKKVCTLAFAIARILEDNGYRLKISAHGEPRILLVPTKDMGCIYVLTPEDVSGTYIVELCEPEVPKMTEAAK